MSNKQYTHSGQTFQLAFLLTSGILFLFAMLRVSPGFAANETTDSQNPPAAEFLEFLMEMEDATGEGFQQWLADDNLETPDESVPETDKSGETDTHHKTANPEPR